MLELMERARQTLAETFGYAAFRPGQAEIIEAVIAGRDSLVLMPTGGGKSLCYQIPSLVREGLGIVVSPLIALMRDQVVALRQLGVRAAYLNSTLRPDEQASVLEALQAGEVQLLYVAPERLLKEQTLAMLAALPVSLIAPPKIPVPLLDPMVSVPVPSRTEPPPDSASMAS